MVGWGWNIEEPTSIEAPCPYTPLPGDDDDEVEEEELNSSPLLEHRQYSSSEAKLLILITVLLGVGLLIGFTTYNTVDYGKENFSPVEQDISSSVSSSIPRGVDQGVSPKSFPSLREIKVSFSWTKEILQWERTAFHFQPKHNWMNDPNGPLLYNGWYHLFYQYNPEGPVWGNIVWAHAVSKDLINWIHLPLAMVSDQWYDINGVWTGSATILHDGQIVMLYTGSTNESVEVQNLAYPVDPSDPFLIEWSKYPGNPVLFPPPGIDFRDFRDPTTAWYTKNGKWRMIIGSKVNTTGISLVYDTVDFKSFELLDSQFHSVAGTGMWECVDFYPVSTSAEATGLDTSDNHPGVKHVMKTSLDDDRNDYYALGTYDETACTWTPDDPRIDVGIGLRYDYGNFYASKSFYDQNKKRRVLWGWITEMDSEFTDIKKGWASVQAIPRTVLFDNKTGKNLLQWPVEEVEQLRTKGKTFPKVVVDTGSVLPLQMSSATQLDIIAEFEINPNAVEMVNGTFNTEYSCSMSGGAAKRGALGPFGFLVLANQDQSEQTAIYFYITKGRKGNFMTFFCADHTRSSKADDVLKGVHGSFVSVLEGEKLSMRILVDHSIIESFAQGGRTCVTSRIYPTTAIYEDAKLFLFNNATDAKITATVKVWEMSKASAAAGSDFLPRPSLLCISFFLAIVSVVIRII